MTTYTIAAPDGKTYEIEGPEGATQAQVAQAVLAQNPQAAAPAPKAGTLETIGANLAGGLGHGLLGVGAAAADYTGFGDTAKTLDEAREGVQQFQQRHGGDTAVGRIAAGVGAMAPALLMPEVGIPALLANGALFAIPGFRDTYNEQLKQGASKIEAAEHGLASAGLMMLGGKLISTGGKALPKALQAGEGILPQLGAAAGEGAVFHAADTVAHKGIDTANDRQTDQPWLDPQGMLESAATFGALRGAKHVMDAPRRAAVEKQQAAAAAAVEQQQALQDNAANESTTGPAAIAAIDNADPRRTLDRAPQPDLLGGEDQQNAPATPATVDPTQRKAELAQQIRTLEDSREEHRDLVAQAATPAESLAAASRFKQIDTALAEAKTAHDAIKIEATPDEKLARAYKNWELAKGNGDVDAVEKAATRISELTAAGAKPPPAKSMTQTPIPLKTFTGKTEDTDIFNQRVVGPEIAAGREQAAAQRAKLEADKAALQDMGKDSDLPYVTQARQERQNQLDVNDMEANRLDTSRTAQTSLFDEPATTRVVRGAEVSGRTREALISDLQQARRDKNPKAAEAALESLRDLKARAGNAQAPEPEGVLAHRASDITTGPATEVTPTRTDTTGADLRKQVAELPADLPAADEAVVQRVMDNSRALVNHSSMEDTPLPPSRRGTVPQRAAEDLSDYLYKLRTGADVTEARARVQQHLDTLEQGKLTEDAGQPQQRDAFPNEAYQGKVLPDHNSLQKFLGSETLHRLRLQLGETTQTIARAMKRVAPIQRRIDQLTDNIAAERAKYERVKEYTDVALGDADASHAAAQARFRAVEAKLDAELQPLQADYLKAQLGLKEALEYARDLRETIATIPADAQGAASARLKVFEERLAKERSDIEQLSVSFVRAKDALERVAKNQQRRVEPRAVKADLAETAADRAQTVAEGRAAREETQNTRAALKGERAAAMKNIADEVAPVERARDARLPQPETFESKRTPEDTLRSQERDEEAGRQRIKDQQVAENLEAIPGERIDQSKYRAVRDAAPVDQTRENRKDALRQKADDETLPKTTRDKAERLLAMMEKEDSTQESRSTAQAESERLAERISALRQQVADNPSKSNKQELARAQRAKDKLGKLLQRAKRTPIDSSRPTDEHIEPGERLPPRKVGPLTKKERIAGNMRTGDNETAGERMLGARNAVQQDGKVAAPGHAYGKKDAKKDNRTADELADQVVESSAQKEADVERAKEAQTAREDAVAEIQQDIAKIDTYIAKKKNEVIAARGDKDRVAEIKELIAKANKLRDSKTDDLADAQAEAHNGREDSFAGEHEGYNFKESPGETPLPKGASDAVINNDTRGVIDVLAKEGSTPEVRALAEKLAPFVEETAIGMNPDLQHKGESVAGLYEHGENRVQLHKDAFTEETALHELTHAATMQVLHRAEKNPASLTAEQSEAVRYLTALHGVVKNHSVFEGEYGQKDLKEFVAEVYTNKDLRAKLDSVGRPKTFLQRITDAIKALFGFGNDPTSKQAMKAIDQIMEKSGRGDTAPTPKETKTKDAIDTFAARILDKRSTVEKLAESKSTWGMALHQAVVDMRSTLRDTFKLGDKQLGEQAYLSLLTQDSGLGNAQAAATHGAFGFRKNKDGDVLMEAGHSKSAKDVVEAISDIPAESHQKSMEIFQTGMTTLRAQDVGWDKLDFADPKAAQREGEAALAQINADPKVKAAFDKARETYRDLSRGLARWVVDTNAVSKEVGEKLLADENYIPFFRNRGDAVEMVMPDGHPVSIGDIRHQPLLHALSGGESKLMDFQEAMFKNIATKTQTHPTHTANRHIAYHLQELGKAAGTMKIQRGDGNANPNAIRWRQAPDKNVPGDDGKRHLIIDTKGTAAEHIPTALLERSVAGTYATLPSFLKAAGWASDLLRSGVTRMPTYVVSQLIKDPFNASMAGNLKRNPLAAAMKTLGLAGSNLSGHTVDAEALHKLGVLHSNVFNGDATDMSKHAMQLMDKNQSLVKRALKQADRIAMVADAATREQAYRDVLNAGGTEAQAIIAARELQNFQKRGGSASVQMVARMVPFFNASIQGLNVIAKSARGNMPASELLDSKKAFYTRAAGLASMAFAYSWLMEDDPDWKKMSMRDKISYIHFPKILGMDEGLRFPAPFETGMLFYSLPMAMAEAMKDGFSASDRKAVADVFMNQMPGNGSLMPQFAKGYYDVSRNNNSGTGQPVVPKSLERLDPTEQYTARTTEAAKRLADGLNAAGVKLSPMQLEYLSNAYVGQLPQAVAVMTNGIFSKARQADVNKPAGHASDTPLLGRFSQNNRGTEDIEHVYDIAHDAIEARNTFDHKAKSGRAAEAREYLQDHKWEIALQPSAAAFQQQMSKLKQAEDAITNMPKISAEDKQARLDRITETKQRIAESFRKVMERFKASAGG